MHKRTISENDHVLFRQYRSIRNLVTNKICSEKKKFIVDLICSFNACRILWLDFSVSTENTNADNVPIELTCDAMNN